MLIWLHRLLLWGCLIQFLSKFDAKCPYGCLASSCGDSFFNSYSKLMQNAHLAALPPPVVASYAILIQNTCKMLSGLPCLLLWWFLIQFVFKAVAICSLGSLGYSCGWFLIQILFKVDAKCSSGCLDSSCGDSLFNSYSKLMRSALLAALPRPVVVSYSILIQN